MDPQQTGSIIRNHRLAQQRLGNARAQEFGHLHNLVRRAQRARADQHRDFFARVQNVRRAPQIAVVGITRGVQNPTPLKSAP